eukprot:COSAG06_NODE_1763_length_8449_cov_184.922275_12_plen_146_part_00
MLAQETDEVPLEDWQQEKILIEEDVHAFIKNRKGREAWTLCFGEKTAPSPPIFLKGRRCVVLPRQARDRHERKNSNKTAFEKQVSCTALRTRRRGRHGSSCGRTKSPGWARSATASGRNQARKRISFAPFYTKNDHFTETGSGQT